MNMTGTSENLPRKTTEKKRKKYTSYQRFRNELLSLKYTQQETTGEGGSQPGFLSLLR